MRTALRNLNVWLDDRAKKLRGDMIFALRQTHMLTLVLRHPEAPWHAKAIAALAVLYILSPIQLIPTFIPVIGQMDDLFVVWLATKLAGKFTSQEVIADCELQAKSRTVTRTSESVAHCGKERPLSLLQSE